MKKIIKAKPLEEQQKLSDQMMADMKAMAQVRFGGKWDEAFKRWDEENEKRKG